MVESLSEVVLFGIMIKFYYILFQLLNCSYANM